MRNRAGRAVARLVDLTAIQGPKKGDIKMSVCKRGRIWWYKFYFANNLVRESAKTSSKTLAKEAEKQRRRELEEGYNGLSGEEIRRASCRERVWIGGGGGWGKEKNEKS